MARKRATKVRSTKHTTELKDDILREGDLEKEKMPSAVKFKRRANSPKKEKTRTSNSSESRPEDSKLSPEIVWRELQFNKDKKSSVALESPFVFKEPVKSPRSSICEAQLNAMFDTPVNTPRPFVHATLNSQGSKRSSIVSMTDRLSRMSSFTSYSSLDSGYQITYSPQDAKNYYLAQKASTIDIRTKERGLHAKIDSLLHVCNGMENTDAKHHQHDAKAWALVPSCCNASRDIDSNKIRSEHNRWQEIRQLGHLLV